MSVKNELIEMIFAAGLLEDFISYLREKKIDIDGLSSLYEVEEEIVLEYAKRQRLVEGLENDLVEDLQQEQEFEPRRLRPRTPPKKK